MRFLKFPICVFSLILLYSLSSVAWESEKVFYGGKETLQYTEDEEHNRIVDFSYSGYRGGCASLPVLEVLETVSTVEGDDTSNIQSAIDKVGKYPFDKNGHRGVVQLSPGTYEVSGVLNISHAGVVLRGSGNGNNPSVDTIIYGTGDSPHQRTLIVLGDGSQSRWRGEIDGTRTNIVDNNLPVGSKTFTVEDSSAYSVGDNIIVVHPITEDWLAAIKYGQPGSDPNWTTSTLDPLTFNTYITEISGKKISIDSPLFEHFDRSLATGHIYKYNKENTASEVGIENLRVDNDYSGNDDENHVWNSVGFYGVENGWAKNVVATHFGLSGFRLSKAARVTIDDCQAIDPISQTTGGRKYGFNCAPGSANILFRDCYSRGSRHSYVSNGTSTVSGMVMLNCTAEDDHTTSEGHRHWSMGILFDNFTYLGTPPGGDRILGLYNRGDWGTAHGWAASHSVIWNSNVNDAKIVVQKPPTSQNYCIGCFAAEVSGNGPFSQPEGYIEGENREGLIPASLYTAQLKEHCSNTDDIDTDTGANTDDDTEMGTEIDSDTNTEIDTSTDSNSDSIEETDSDNDTDKDSASGNESDAGTSAYKGKTSCSCDTIAKDPEFSILQLVAMLL